MLKAQTCPLQRASERNSDAVGANRFEDQQQVLRNVWSALEPCGDRAGAQHPGLYGPLDQALEHKTRYTRKDFERALTDGAT